MGVDFKQAQKVAERLLTGGLRGSDVRAVAGEAKRLVTVLAQKRDAHTAQELIRRLAEQNDLHRTNQTHRYFAAVRDALNLLRNHPAEEQARLLGWACRLLQYEALQREQQQPLQKKRSKSRSSKGGKRR